MPLPLIPLVLVAAQATAEVSIWVYVSCIGTGVVIGAGAVGGIYCYTHQNLEKPPENLSPQSVHQEDIRTSIDELEKEQMLMKKVAYQSLFDSGQTLKKIQLTVEEIQVILEKFSFCLRDKELSLDEFRENLRSLESILTPQTIENFEKHLQQKKDLMKELKSLQRMIAWMINEQDCQSKHGMRGLA